MNGVDIATGLVAAANLSVAVDGIRVDGWHPLVVEGIRILRADPGVWWPRVATMKAPMQFGWQHNDGRTCTALVDLYDPSGWADEIAACKAAMRAATPPGFDANGSPVE